MIRILHVVTMMNRNGLENRIMDIYRNIDRTKIQFDFLTHRKEEGHFDKEILELGGRIYYNNPISVKNIFQYISDINDFFKQHKEYKIVHSHVNTLSTWVLWAAKKSGTPVRIAHSRTWGMEKNWRSVFKWFSKLFINIPTTHKFACSKQAGIWLFGKKGITGSNYFKVIPNSIQIDKFTYNFETRKKIRKELRLEEGQLAFINVGRLVPQKNQIFLLKVFSEILKKSSDAKLYIIGEGELKDNLLNECKLLAIENNVEFLGVKSNVGDYLNAADAFVFPSLFEGFGTVVIEAQCSGLKVFASDSIPPETKVCELVEFIGLKYNTKIWAEKIIQSMYNYDTKNRDRYAKVVKEKGYDIKDTFDELQKFYLSFYEGNDAI